MKRNLLVFLLFALLSARLLQATTLEISAPALYKSTMIELGNYFEQSHADWHVEYIPRLAEDAAEHLKQGGSFDVVLVYDDKNLKLFQEKLAADTDIFLVASNSLVIIAEESSEIVLTDLKTLITDDWNKVALLKETHPAGKMARVFLEKEGLMEKLKDHIDDVKSVKNAVESVKNGKSKWAILYAADAARHRGIKTIWKISEKAAPSSKLYAVIPNNAVNKDAAREFVTLLGSTFGKKLWENSGYTIQQPAAKK